METILHLLFALLFPLLLLSILYGMTQKVSTGKGDYFWLFWRVLRLVERGGFALLRHFLRLLFP